MKKYQDPFLEIIVFEPESEITASGDYHGVNWEDLV